MLAKRAPSGVNVWNECSAANITVVSRNFATLEITPVDSGAIVEAGLVARTKGQGRPKRSALPYLFIIEETSEHLSLFEGITEEIPAVGEDF